jgi:CubicO group peptidase (beta-lactamase class C family)
MLRLDPARRAAPLLLVGALACAHLARPERVYLDHVVAPGGLPATLNATMREFAREGFSGAVLVAQRGRVLLYQGYGDANRARHIPNTAETKYPLGAVANQFIAAAILTLEQEGRLRLDQRAADLIGPEAGSATIAQLLARAGEVPAQSEATAGFGALGRTPRVDRFLDRGPSYALLERVISAAAARPAGTVLQERLFRPAGMDRVVMDDGLLDDSLVARGYTAPYGKTVVVTGLVAPLADLYHWHQALQLGTVLAPALRNRMATATANGYGYGWVVDRTAAGVPVIEHASDEPGFQLWYAYFPDQDVLVLLAANTDDGFRQPIAARLTTLLAPSAYAADRRVTRDGHAGGE